MYHNQSKKRVHKKPFKSKKETIELERYKKAKLLKSYAKLCASEGIVSNRVHIGPKEASIQDPSNKNNTKQYKKTKKFKQNPFSKAEKIAIEYQKEKQDEINRKKQIAEEIENNKKKKAKKSKTLMAKTKRGQPVLSNHISVMLDKLKSESS